MSRQLARTVMDQFHLRPALVSGRYAMAPEGTEVTSMGLMADLRELSMSKTAASVPRSELVTRERQAKVDLLSAYGYTPFDDDEVDSKPFAYANGLAIIPIHGMLINRFAYSLGFVTGYNFIRQQLDAAMSDNDVLGIVYDVNTQGGMVAGCRETSEAMYAASARGGNGKPSIAVVDANCYSAGYMVACAADRIAATPTGGAGSIGVLLMHVDVSAAMEKMGVKVTFIFSGDHKVDGNMFEPLPDAVKATLQAEITSIYTDFVELVSAYRPSLTVQQVIDTQAGCFLAQDALKLGLIDAVQTPTDALQAFFNGESEDEEGEPSENHNPEDEIVDDEDEDPENDDDEDDKHKEQSNMTVTTERKQNIPNAGQQAPRVDANAVAADARKTERERIQAILTHTEAEGRSEQANYLAYETDMTVEAAATLLSKSAKATPPAPVAVVEQKDTNFFGKTMDNSKHPNVGGDNNDAAAEGGGEMTRAQQIRAASQKARGKAPEEARK